MKKRILSFIMCICLLFEMIPSSAYAAEMGDMFNETVSVSGGDVLDGNVSGGDVSEGDIFDGNASDSTESDEDISGGDISGGDISGGDEPVQVTRIEWLRQLTQTFEMTVEEDNYPDNYFSDVNSNSEFYHELMLATEFGLVDVEAGKPFEPDKAATREFAAHTLNLCLGYQLEDTAYTFKEANLVTYPVDLQIAINKGWFTLVNDAVLPNQGITIEEKDAMLAFAKGVQDSVKLDPDHENKWEFVDDVIVLPEGTNAEYTSETEITIYNCPVALKEGDKFGIVLQGFPIVKKVTKVVSADTDYVIEAESVDVEEGFKEADIHGSVSADITKIVAEEGVQVTYIVGGTVENQWEDGVEYESLDEVGEQTVSAVTLTEEYELSSEIENQFNLADGFKVEITYTISDPDAYYDVDYRNSSAYFIADFVVTVNCNVTEDVLEAAGIKTSIPLFKIPVLLVGYVKCSVELELKGKLTFTLTENIRLGLQVSKSGGLRMISEFKKKRFTIEARVTTGIWVKLAVGFDVAGVLKGEVYGKLGAQASAAIKTYDDGEEPKICTEVYAYLGADYGVIASFKIKIGTLSFFEQKYKDQFLLYNEKNSPVRILLHWDDGKSVSSCVRDNKDPNNPQSSINPCVSGNKYYTPVTSKYTYSGANSGKNENGEPYTIFKYSLDEDENATITSYNGNVSALTIPDTLDGYKVVGIGNKAFYNNTRLYIVNIPDSVTSIGDFAFEGCNNLSSVYLSRGLSSIGRGAFKSCVTLTAIEIPKSLRTVVYSNSAFANESSNSVFNGCTALKTITFEEGMSTIPAHLFLNCPGIETINIPDTVTSIGAGAFQECKNLKDVVLPDSVTSLGSDAYLGCSNITKVEFSNNIVSIGKNCFAECEKLEKAQLPNKLQNLGSGAFQNCTALSSVTIPKTLTSVGYEYAGGYSVLIGSYVTGSGPLNNKGPFNQCPALKEVIFEEGITQIPQALFAHCNGLEEIVIPDSVTSIKAQAFDQCVNVEKIIIGSSVTRIEEGAFANCNKVTEIDLPDSITVIGNYCFGNCTHLKKLVLPSKLKNIGEGAFAYCKGIESVYIPKEITYVGIVQNCGPFYGCINLDEVEFAVGIKEIPSGLFQNCSGLTRISIPNTVNLIGANAFKYCASIESVEISNSVTYIENEAFYGNSSLKEINIPDSVTGMGTNIFANCTALEKAHIPNIRKNITEGTFYNCTSLKEINMPDSVINIAKNAFRNCDALVDFTFSPNITTIGENAFYDCDNLIKMELPQKLTSIGQYAFADNDVLETVVIPNSVTSIGNYAFNKCAELKNVTLGGGLQTIPQYAFSNCGNIEQIVIPYGISKIDKYAFANDTKLLTITIPRTVTSIDSTAFSYGSKMTVYGVPGTYAQEWAESVEATFVGNEVHATEVSLDKTELTLYKGANTKLALRITPEDFTDEVDWKSSNTSVVTVDSTGKLTAKEVGTATIKVTVGDLSASCKVTVVQPVTSISINKTSISMEALDSYQLTVTVNPSNAFNKDVVWISSDESVVTVDQSGRINALAKGTAKVTVTTQDGSNLSKTCSVTVTNNAVKASTVNELESPHPYTNNCKDKWIYTLEGADKIQVTFSPETMVEDGFDFLYIYDKDKNQIGKYTGEELAGKTIIIPGDTIIIQMSSDNGGTEYGFKVLELQPYVKDRVAAPIANLKSQEVDYGTEITLETETEGASIYYTLDGTEPSSNSTLYTKPITIYEDTTVRAIAVKEEYANSTIATYTYTLTTCVVTFDSNGGSYVAPQRVIKKLYAEEPKEPTKEDMNFAGWYLNGVLYDFDDPVTTDITLVASWTEYEVLQMPKANLKSGMQVPKGTAIILSNPVQDAIIYYTTDGTEPTRDSLIYTTPVTVNDEITIKAFAVKWGYKNSEVATFHYTVSDDGNIWGDVEPEDIPEDGIPDGMWVAGVKDMNYTGKPIKQNIRVYDGKTLLMEKKDYTIAYKNNTNAAGRDALKAPSIIVSGKGNYEGKTTITFAILPQDIGEDNPLMTADDLTVAYTGKAQKPVPVVTFNGKKLAVKKDYTVTYTDTTTDSYIEPGTYEIILNGTGNYTGTRVITYTITNLIPISKVKLSPVKAQTYQGWAVTPELTMKNGNYALVEGIDYEATYYNNIYAGTATILIEGKGFYTGTRRVEFKINGISISKGSVFYEGNGEYTYNGELHTPKCYLEVPVGGGFYTTLTEDQDYTVTFINNRNAGKVTIIFTGINGYCGTLKRTIKIDPFELTTDEDNEFNIELADEVAYSKNGVTPKPVITFNGTVLKEGRDYTLKYANNQKVANASDEKAPTIIVNGKGNFKGSKTVTFSIVPQDISELSMVASDKVYQNKAKAYVTKIEVLDSRGKKLAVKKDYDIVKYTYANGDVVKDTHIIPAGTEIYVTVRAKEGSGFTGELTGSYRIVQADISKVTVKVADQTYTGSAITPGKDQMTLTIKKLPVSNDDYEIVSYSNNVKKGTATVIIKGTGNYGGTKKVTFKIKGKKIGFLWW